MKHYVIVVRLNLPERQKEILRNEISAWRRCTFSHFSEAVAKAESIEYILGLMYGNFYTKYARHGAGADILEWMLVGHIDGIDFARIAIKEVVS